MQLLALGHVCMSHNFKPQWYIIRVLCGCAAGAAEFSVGASVPHLDAVICCTGYSYHFPFLDLKVRQRPPVTPMATPQLMTAGMNPRGVGNMAGGHPRSRGPGAGVEDAGTCMVLHTTGPLHMLAGFLVDFDHSIILPALCSHVRKLHVSPCVAAGAWAQHAAAACGAALPTHVPSQ